MDNNKRMVLAAVALVLMLGLALIATLHDSTWASLLWVISGFLASVLAVQVRWPGWTPIWILNCLPGFQPALAYQQALRENEQIERTLAHALKVYEIEIKETPLGSAELSAFNNRAQRISECCLKAAQQMGTPEPEALAGDLEVLFYDVEGEVPATLWFSPDETRRRQLASTLLERSGRFQRWQAKLNLEQEHLAEVLSWKDRYRLASVEADLERVTDLWRDACAFYNFLAANDLPPAHALPDLSTLLQTVHLVGHGHHPRLLANGPIKDLNQKSPNQALLLLVLIDLGIAAIFSPLNNAELERRCLLSLAAFFTRNATGTAIKPAVCSLLALLNGGGPCTPYNRSGVKISWEYLKTKQDLRSGVWKSSRPYLSLGEFFPTWEERFKEHASTTALAEELDIEYLALLGGRWPTRREELLLHLFGKDFLTPHPGAAPGPTGTLPPTQPTPLSGPPSATVSPAVLMASLPATGRELRALAGGLELSTVELFLESGTVTPYLITLGPSSGLLPKLLDCLTSEKKLKALKAKKQITIEGTYDFEHYTPYSRIGVLPKGVSFETFAQRFRRDVETLIAHQTDVLDSCSRNPVGAYYEILLHTFNPTVCNPFWFGQPKEGRAAVQRIKDLFARTLPEEDLYRMVAYEWGRRLREDTPPAHPAAPASPTAAAA